MKFIENLLSIEVSNLFEQTLLNSGEIWKYNEFTAPNVIKDKRIIDSSQFTHLLVNYGKPCSDLYNFAEYLISSLNIDCSIIRAKINMMLPSNNMLDDKKFNMPHKDSEDSFQSLIYYVNDSDGDTVFFNENLIETDRITPKKNCAVLFPSNMYHASANPKKYNRRIVVNLVLDIKDNVFDLA